MLINVSNSVVRDNIESNRLIEFPASIRKVVDSREFQRLRHIKQMGLSSYVFPGAEHSRLTHSLGVFATAKQAFSHLQRKAAPLLFKAPWYKFDDKAELDFSIAALTHDIGHTAFSHVLEHTLLPQGFRSHEDCTLALIGDDTAISREIKNCADIQSVLAHFEKKHPNKALSDLISSAFDVDRCDYILRDSTMAGVEYGKYDLKWLIHSMNITRGTFLRAPTLLLDGPRGIDALRQFLSARRYLHRQVYYHPTIRAAQIALKGIFERMQDIAKDEIVPVESVRQITPECFWSLLKNERPTLGEFVETTDVEIYYMIKSYLRHHHDPVIKYLCEQFMRREFPQCILDSSRRVDAIEKKFSIALTEEEGSQKELWDEHARKAAPQIRVALTEFVAKEFAAIGLPPEAAKYTIAFDSVTFTSVPPTDLLFAFKDRTVPISEVGARTAGFDLESLMESFTIDRLFVPENVATNCSEYLENEFGLKGATRAVS